VIYTMHTLDAVHDFSRTRAKPAIEASPYLSARMTGIDSARVKQFVHEGGGVSVIFFRGAQASSGALSEPADMVVHDEVDFSRPDILRLYEDRTAASNWARRLCVGTPTVPKFGMDALWQDSSQTHWCVRCPACGDEQPLSWPDGVAVDASEPYYICARGHELTREVIRAGRWVDARTVGDPTWRIYHVSRLLLPNWPAGRIVEAHAREDFPELFANQVLGEAATSGEAQVDEAVLAKVMIDFPALESSEEYCFLGCDQSPRAGEHRVVIGLPDAEEGLRSIVHVETCDWDRLARLMEMFRVDVAVIDAQPETTKARELAAQFRGRVWLAWYPNMPTKEREVYKRDRQKRTVNIDRTASLDLSAARLRGQQDFFCAMPADLRAKFIAEMCAPQRTVQIDDHGQPHARWVETGPDHFRHAHNYMTIAAMIFGRRMPAGDRPVALELRGSPEREVEGVDARTGETVKHKVRPGYIPVPDGVVGGPASWQPIDWRKI